MAENDQQLHIDIAPPVEDAPSGVGQKRPAETEPDGGEDEAQQPTSKAPRIADGALPLEQQVAQLKHELEEARAEASKWRKECETLRQQLAAAAAQQQQQQHGQPNGGAAAAAEATIRSLNVQLREAKSSIDQLRQAARGHVQKLQHYEHQLKQAHDRRERDFHGPPRFPPGPPLPPPPGPGFGGPPPPPGPWGGPQHGMGPYGGGPGYGPQQGPHGPPPPGPQGGGYFDGWGGWQPGGPAPPGPGPAGPQGGEYWTAAYPPGPGPDPAAMAAAQPPQQLPQHAPYYTQTGPPPGAADPYAQQQQQQQPHLAAAAHVQPGVPQPAAAVPVAPAPAGPQPGGGAAAVQPQRGPGSSGVDEEALFWELEPGKREIMDRFARSYPVMVEPSNAKSMTITDFKEMSEPQLESFFSWLSQNCNPSRPLKHPGGFVRVKHTEWKKLVERGYA